LLDVCHGVLRRAMFVHDDDGESGTMWYNDFDFSSGCSFKQEIV